METRVVPVFCVFCGPFQVVITTQAFKGIAKCPHCKMKIQFAYSDVRVQDLKDFDSKVIQ